MKEKITSGANDRPKNETIAQSGRGLPDDSGSVIEVDEEGVAKVREKLEETDRHLIDAGDSETSKVNRDLNEAFEGDDDNIPSSVPAGGPPD